MPAIKFQPAPPRTCMPEPVTNIIIPADGEVIAKSLAALLAYTANCTGSAASTEVVDICNRFEYAVFETFKLKRILLLLPSRSILS